MRFVPVDLTKLSSLKTGIKIPISLLIIIFQQFQVVQLMDMITFYHLICYSTNFKVFRFVTHQ